MNLRVAGLQMPVSEIIEVNAQYIRAAIERAAAAEAEILLTPEGSLSGYRPDFDPERLAEAMGSVLDCAWRHNVGLALGTCAIEADGRCYNELRFYRPSGEYLGFHSKTLLCAQIPPRCEDEINHYAVAPLRVFEWAPGLTIGGLICNDLWANPPWTPMPDPHLTQRLAEMGARVIFHAVNGGRDGSEISNLNWRYHEANLRLRAQAADAWIVTVDNADPTDLPCSAPCGVVDNEGRWVCHTEPQDFQLFVHTLDLSRGGSRRLGQSGR